jgi:hypothetical protein
VAAIRECLIDALTDDEITRLADIMDGARAHLRELVPVHPPRKRRAPAPG